MRALCSRGPQQQASLTRVAALGRAKGPVTQPGWGLEVVDQGGGEVPKVRLIAMNSSTLQISSAV